MASSLSGDSCDSDIYNLKTSLSSTSKFFSYSEEELYCWKKSKNIVNKLTNRQVHGRFAKHSKAHNEKLFSDIYYKCRYRLAHVIPEVEALNHIFMGFTLCGNYFISYTSRIGELLPTSLFPTVEYDLYVWRFVPGQKLQFVSKHRIFKLLKNCFGLEDVTFIQYPRDPYKLICFAFSLGYQPLMFLTILTLPTKNCRNCSENCGLFSQDENLTQGWCSKHGFMLHFMFNLAHPMPQFSPHISLAFPEHIVINTGHCIHILNISTLQPVRNLNTLTNSDKEYYKLASHAPSCTCIDNVSEVSESPSELLPANNSVVDAILEDFSEYDLEGNDYNKPFHELNISCEPLNVTGKNYHNTLVQNIVDTRLKHLQNSNKDCIFSVPQTSGLQVEKSKVDKNTAEKAYEFTEENEKCEKLSLFRKKRLADKKYEFSEDNSENIVPFYSLKRERRYFYRSQPYCIKSPEFANSLFLSPCSPGLRSPMQSPNSRNGQFSPSSARNLHCSFIRNCSHYSRSPISPKESARKFNVYSPGLDSDCSDSDSRLILKQLHNFPNLNCTNEMKQQHSGLLIVDTKRDYPKWIKKVVKRYSSVDFENGSLLSGHSRDDYNVPIEIPVLVQTLTEQLLDIVPETRTDQVSETQLIITQRTFDCDQFVQSRAQKLCLDSNLNFLHCQDYDISIVQICPLNGEILCKAVITICALQDLVPYGNRNIYIAECYFTWNIISNAFDLIEAPVKLQTQGRYVALPLPNIPITVQKNLLVMKHIFHESKTSIRDYNNHYEICMDDDDTWSGTFDSIEYYNEYSIASDTD